MPVEPLVPEGDAVITELRYLVRLPEILLNYLTLLPSSWTVHFLHGHDNHLIVRASPELQHYLRSGRLRLRALKAMAPEHYEAALAARDLAAGGLSPHDRAKHLKYVHWHDEFLIGPEFWAAFTAPQLMLFQTDSALCPQPTVPLAQFARYVFTGAPWRRGSLGMCRASKEFRCVGNSGVSLWRRDVMSRFVASSWFVSEWGPRQHLDVYMSHKLQNANQASETHNPPTLPTTQFHSPCTHNNARARVAAVALRAFVGSRRHLCCKIHRLTKTAHETAIFCRACAMRWDTPRKTPSRARIWRGNLPSKRTMTAVTHRLQVNADPRLYQSDDLCCASKCPCQAHTSLTDAPPALLRPQCTSPNGTCRTRSSRSCFAAARRRPT